MTQQAAGRCLAALVALAAAAAAQSAVPAYTLRHEILGEHAEALLGNDPTVLGDVNDDGVPDVALGAPGDGQGSPGTVVVASGRDLSPLYTIPGDAPSDYFGQSVAAIDDLDGDGIGELVVGAPQLFGPGYARVHSGSDGRLLLVLPTPGGTVSFGASVSGAGDVDADGVPDVVVGDPDYLHDDFWFTDHGGLRVFSGADGAVLLTYIGAEVHNLGVDVAAAGDVNGDGFDDVLVSGIGPIDDHGLGQGHVRLLSGSGGSTLKVWAAFLDDIGSSVAGVGDVDGDGVPDVLTSGFKRARLLSGSSGAVLLQLDEAGRVSSPGDLDGDSVPELIVGEALFSGADGTVIVKFDELTTVIVPGDLDGDSRFDLVGTQPGADSNGVDAGRAVLIANPLVLLRQSWSGRAPGDLLGWSVSDLGDVDTDGHADLALGVPLSDAAGMDAGEARALSGAGGEELFATLGATVGDEAGRSVADAGDVDGDGVHDLVVGAPRAGSGGVAPGTATVVSGSDGAVLHLFQGTAHGDRFGSAVSGAGDLDGDGRAEIVVGAPLEDLGPIDAGVVRVFSGADGHVLHAFTGGQTKAQLGSAVSGGSDVDGDGIPDVAIGAPRYDAPELDTGQVRVHSGADGALLYVLFGEGDRDGFGSAVAFAGDLDLDGRDDLLVGAPQPEGTGDRRGLAYAFSGRDGTPLFTWEGRHDGALFGSSVDGADDVDGDGRLDVVVGAPGDRPVLDDDEPCGTTTVFDGTTGLALFTVAGSAGDELGRSVAGAGDVDGNGLADIVVGLPLADGPQVDAGAAHVLGLSSVIAPWVELGAGLAGANGLPQLKGVGAPVPDAPVTLELHGAAPISPFVLVLGGSADELPFKGGVLVPHPDLLVGGLATDAAGSWTLESRWPPAWPPGFVLILQTWIVDAAGPQGFAASNALEVTLP